MESFKSVAAAVTLTMSVTALAVTACNQPPEAEVTLVCDVPGIGRVTAAGKVSQLYEGVIMVGLRDKILHVSSSRCAAAVPR